MTIAFYILKKKINELIHSFDKDWILKYTPHLPSEHTQPGTHQQSECWFQKQRALLPENKIVTTEFSGKT